MVLIGNMQLGKKGLTENFIQTLKSYFKKHKNVKISILKNSDERKNMKLLSEKILKKLGENYSARIIGFTIAIKKLGKAKNLNSRINLIKTCYLY